MADRAVQFSIRLPEELRDAVVRLAKEENRSLNGQIVQLCKSAVARDRVGAAFSAGTQKE